MGVTEETTFREIDITGPRRWFWGVSLVSNPFDILGWLAGFTVVFGLFILLVAGFGPLVFSLLTSAGAPPGSMPRDFYTDLQGLYGATLVRMALFTPPVFFVLLRNRLVVPLSSKLALTLAAILSVFSLLLVGSIYLSFAAPQSVLASGMIRALQWTGNGALQGIFWLYLLTLALSSLFYLPLVVINLAYRRRLGLPAILSTSRGVTFSYRRFFRVAAAQLLRWRILVRVGMLLIAALYAAGAMQVFFGRGITPSLAENAVYRLSVALFDQGASGFNTALGASVALFPVLAGALGLTLVFGVWLSSRRVVAIAVAGLLVNFLMVPFVLTRSDLGDGATASLFAASAAFNVIIVALLPLSALMAEIRYAFRFASISAAKAAQKGRAPLLYLRAFALDDETVRGGTGVLFPFSLLSIFRIRLEEVIARTSFRFAPLTAVGNPTEDRPNLGAIRKYLSDTQWQPFVSEQIETSDGIIFLMGVGAYTGWEAERILEHDALHKTILVVPPDPKQAVAYLDAIPELKRQLGGDAIIKRIAARGVLCIYLRAGQVRLVTTATAKDALSYRMAISKAIVDHGAAAA